MGVSRFFVEEKSKKTTPQNFQQLLRLLSFYGMLLVHTPMTAIQHTFSHWLGKQHTTEENT